MRKNRWITAVSGVAITQCKAYYRTVIGVWNRAVEFAVEMRVEMV